MPNFLEQLIAEWYEFRGYFVRRNINVGKRDKGGHESELDVVAFHPGKNHLVHIEPSMDSASWTTREARYLKKFAAGRAYIPELFSGFPDLPPVEQIALLVIASSQNHTTLGGGRLMIIDELMREILDDPDDGLRNRSVRNAAVPEQFVILRSLQFAGNYWPLAPR